MYENLMDEVVTEDNRKRALDAVTRNKGAAGIDRMTTKELENHLQTRWEKIRAKLLDGTYVPSPGPEVEIDGQACHLTSCPWRSPARPAGGNTEAKRGRKNAGHPDGDGPVRSAVAAASADAGIRAVVQRP